MRLGLRTARRRGAGHADPGRAGLPRRPAHRLGRWAGAGWSPPAASASAAATLRPQAIEEPRYEGLLVNAPAIVGDARRIANDYSKYAEQLQRLVGNVSQLYTTVSALPVYEPAPGTTRVLHVSDMHLNPTGWQLIRTVVEQFGIDVVIDTGDITDWGSEPEASYVGSIGLLQEAVRLHPRQPRLGDDRRRGGPPAERDRAGQLDHHGRRADHRRHRRPALHPGQERPRRPAAA